MEKLDINKIVEALGDEIVLVEDVVQEIKQIEEELKDLSLSDKEVIAKRSRLLILYSLPILYITSPRM